MRLGVAKGKLKQWLEEHVEKDEEGNPKSLQVNNEWQDWIYKSDKDKSEYKEKYDAFMSMGVDIYC